MRQDTVKSISIAQEQKAGYTLNLIVFVSGYCAMEKATALTMAGVNLHVPYRSNFSEGACCVYNVTHPGRGGKPDWIEFIRNCEDPPKDDEQKGRPFEYNIGSAPMKEFLFVMQNSVNNAVQLYLHQSKGRVVIPRVDPADFSKEELITLLDEHWKNTPLQEVSNVGSDVTNNMVDEVLHIANQLARGILDGANNISKEFINQ